MELSLCSFANTLREIYLCRIMQRQYGEMKIFLAYLLQQVHQQCTNSGNNILNSLYYYSLLQNSLRFTISTFGLLICRPQPSWDRTCTAAAAIGLLSELSLLPQLSSYGLDKQADSVEEALVVLLDSLTGRRLRMGRSITRKVRNTINIC